MWLCDWVTELVSEKVTTREAIASKNNSAFEDILSFMTPGVKLEDIDPSLCCLSSFCEPLKARFSISYSLKITHLVSDDI